MKSKKSLMDLKKIIEVQSFFAQANFDLDEFMELIIKQTQKLTSATGVVVELVEGKEMVYRAANGTVKKYVGLRLPIDNSISGLCIKKQSILRSNDTYKDKRVNKQACILVQARSLIVAPLLHEDKAVGVLKILSRNANAFTDHDVQSLELMAGLIGSGLAHQIFYDMSQKLLSERTQALNALKKAEKKLQHIANYDHLTDLPNRSLFFDRLKFALTRAKRSQKIIALLFIDLDFFKNINDTYGHNIGDELLKTFAHRVKKSIRASDTLARLGGDEFVILLDELTSRSSAILIAKKIISRINERFCIKRKTLQITISIGIAFYETGSIRADSLIKKADTALYIAKKSGRNTYKVFTASSK